MSTLRPCLQRPGFTPTRRPVGSMQARPTMVAVVTRHLERLLVLSPSAVDPSTGPPSLHGCHPLIWLRRRVWCALTHRQMDTPAQQGCCRTWMELYPIVLTCATWAAHWERLRICFHFDNQAVQAAVRSGTCPEVICQLHPSADWQPTPPEAISTLFGEANHLPPCSTTVSMH